MIVTQNLPTNPGCYLFKDSSNTILYVGKAKNLKKRVSSYFQKKNHDSKTSVLVKKIDTVDFIVTETEVEALILENNLIKEHKPKFNINLKDSKQYAYIKVTNEKFPRLVVARKKTKDGHFFGPFVSGSERDSILKMLQKTFRIRTCKKMPKRACLRYHINLCNAPCVGKQSHEDYIMGIENATLILKGKTKDLLQNKKKEMDRFSKEQNFESALEIRNQMNAIEYLNERQNMQRKKRIDEDIISYIVKNDRVYLLIFNILDGMLINKKEFIFDYHLGFFEEFIVQYYSEEDVPKELVVPIKLDQSLNDYLSHVRKSRVAVTVPRKGEKKKLLDLVKKNIELSFLKNEEALERLQEKLKLPKNPDIIECFDISHLSGSFTVGSMVQFRLGLPDKTNYRRFKIKTVDGIDDFESIAEVVKRRYTRLLKEKAELPDLIVIDGGKGQLRSAYDVLRMFGLRIPIISLAKRLEEIFVPGSSYSIKLSKKDKGLQLLQRIRDEAHRFAISYNRLLRKKDIRK